MCVCIYFRCVICVVSYIYYTQYNQFYVLFSLFLPLMLLSLRSLLKLRLFPCCEVAQCCSLQLTAVLWFQFLVPCVPAHKAEEQQSHPSGWCQGWCPGWHPGLGAHGQQQLVLLPGEQGWPSQSSSEGSSRGWSWSRISTSTCTPCCKERDWEQILVRSCSLG